MASLAILCSLVGCSSSNNKGKIEGTTWTSLPQLVQGQPAADGFLSISFGADRTFSYKIGDSTLTGKYSIGSGDKVTLFYDKPVAKKTKHVHTFKVREQELEMTDEEGNVRKFRKSS